ncbi:hypothetical protein MAHJHV27_13840 [Mycobacterium avium subsp. hominissuis]
MASKNFRVPSVATARSRAVVLGKYRYTVFRLTPSSAATSAMVVCPPRRRTHRSAAATIRATASSSLRGGSPCQP